MARGQCARWRARAWIQAKRSQPRNRPDHWLRDTVVVGEAQALVSSSGRQGCGCIAGRAAMAAAVMRDRADNGRQRIDCRLIGRTRRLMIMRRRMMPMRSRGFPMAVVCTKTRAERPAQRKHGEYGDNGCAEAPPPEEAHQASISPNQSVPTTAWCCHRFAAP